MILENTNKKELKFISLFLLLVFFLSVFSLNPLSTIQSDKNNTNENQGISSPPSLAGTNSGKTIQNLRTSPPFNLPVKDLKTQDRSLSTTNTASNDQISLNNVNSLSSVSSLNSVSSLHNYTMFVNTTNFKWLDAFTNGTPLGISGDDVAGSMNLPFNFDFYGQSFSTVYISSNGWLSFNNTNPTAYLNPSFPDSTDYYVIAPFWDDLVSTNTDIYGWTTSSFAVIDFYNLTYFSPTNSFAGTFEVVLFANGSIVFNYQSMGIQGTPTIGLNYGLNSSYFNDYTGDLTNVTNFQIYFSYTFQGPDLGVTFSSPSNIVSGSSALLNATVINDGNTTENSISLFMYANGSLLSNTIIPSLSNGSSYSFNYSWSPSTIGVYNITVYVLPVTGETFLANNLQTNYVQVVGPLLQYKMAVNITSTPWFDAVSNGVNLNINGDDVSGSLNLGFNFPFYDSFFSTVYISSNGYLSFSDTNPTVYSNPTFPTSTSTNVISPFWNDLIASNNIYGWVTSSYAVIEFQNFYYLSGSLAGTFEVVLYQNGTILFNYQNTGPELTSTIGLNFGTNTNYYTNVNYGLSYVNNTEIIFTTGNLPPYHDLRTTLQSLSGIVIGGTTNINATVTNDGSINETNIPLSVWINGNAVASTTISSLLTGQSYTLNYVWTPSFSSTYNVTASVPNLAGEIFTSNNRMTKFVQVGSSVINGQIGDYFTFVLNSTSTYYPIKFTITQFIGNNLVKFSMDTSSIDTNTGSISNTGSYWIIVNRVSRFIENGSVWNQTYLFLWTNTGLSVGEHLSLFSDNQATVLAQTTFQWQQNIYNVYNISFLDSGYYDYGLFDINTGILLYLTGFDSGFMNQSSLININPVIMSFGPEILGNGGLTYNVGTTGHNISWTVIGNGPGTYIIYLNGVNVTQGTWNSGIPINLSIDGLAVGTYEYNITATDSYNYTSSSFSYVYVNNNSYARSPVNSTSTATSSSSSSGSSTTSTSSSQSSNTSNSTTITSPGFELLSVFVGLSLIITIKRKYIKK